MGPGPGALQGQGLLVDVRTVPVGETRGFWDGWASCLHDGVITLAAAVRAARSEKVKVVGFMCVSPQSKKISKSSFRFFNYVTECHVLT